MDDANRPQRIGAFLKQSELFGSQHRGFAVAMFEAQPYHLPVHPDRQRHGHRQRCAQSTKLVETGVGDAKPDTPGARTQRRSRANAHRRAFRIVGR